MSVRTDISFLASAVRQGFSTICRRQTRVNFIFPESLNLAAVGRRGADAREAQTRGGSVNGWYSLAWNSFHPDLLKRFRRSPYRPTLFGYQSQHTRKVRRFGFSEAHKTLQIIYALLNDHCYFLGRYRVFPTLSNRDTLPTISRRTGRAGWLEV